MPYSPDSTPSPARAVWSPSVGFRLVPRVWFVCAPAGSGPQPVLSSGTREQSLFRRVWSSPLNPLPQEHLIENEVSILRRVKHPNIIMLIEEMETTTELFLVMELVKVRGGEIPGESVSAASWDLAVFSETLNWKCTLLPWNFRYLWDGCWFICAALVSFFSHLLQADELCLSPHSPATVDLF